MTSILATTILAHVRPYETKNFDICHRPYRPQVGNKQRLTYQTFLFTLQLTLLTELNVIAWVIAATTLCQHFFLLSFITVTDTTVTMFSLTQVGLDYGTALIWLLYVLINAAEWGVLTLVKLCRFSDSNAILLHSPRSEPIGRLKFEPKTRLRQLWALICRD